MCQRSKDTQEIPSFTCWAYKVYMLGPGLHWNMCIFVAFGDRFCLVGIGAMNVASPPWVLPELHSTSHPGSKIGNHMKALLSKARGGAAAYQDFAIDTLPDNVAAAGVRHGVTDHVQVLAPIEINLHGTGQSSRAQESTFRENYARANRGACSTVQRMLAGFPAPQWGTTSAGPFSPRLECLKDIGVDLKLVDVLVDELYNIHSSSSPSFQKGGDLRPFIEACFAAQIKAYSERVVASCAGVVCVEMRDVCLKMQTAVRQHYLRSVEGMPEDPHMILMQWSQQITVDFEKRNLDILTRTDVSGEANAAQNAVIARLADSVSTLSSKVTGFQDQTQH